MRRLYILLAAVVIASTVVAVTMSSAGAGVGVTKRYVAIVTAPTEQQSFDGYGYSKVKAQQNAYLKCQSWVQGPASYCKDAVWVYNGWAAVAYEVTVEKPYKQLEWGSGWGLTKEQAEDAARKSCYEYAREQCRTEVTAHTPHTSMLQTKGEQTKGGPL
jgi:Domain of unknown function (DUF4189)